MVDEGGQTRSDLNFAITLDGRNVQAQDSAFDRGSFLETSKGSMQNVKKLYGIVSLQVPTKWLKVEQDSALAEATTFRHSNIDKTQISFFGSRRELDEQSGEAFKHIVNSDLPTPRIIYSEAKQGDNEANIRTIQELTNALGRTLVGDNQLTSTKDRTPAFHLETAKVETINGKMSLPSMAGLPN